MNHNVVFEIPDELSLLEFFGVGPSESVPRDGYWSYDVTDENNDTLNVSFNVLERSFQTILYVRDREIARLLQEGAVKMFITQVDDRAILTCKFEFENAESSLQIEVSPKIKLHLGTLVVE
jgi:hypothetical protein